MEQLGGGGAEGGTYDMFLTNSIWGTKHIILIKITLTPLAVVLVIQQAVLCHCWMHVGETLEGLVVNDDWPFEWTNNIQCVPADFC